MPDYHTLFSFHPDSFDGVANLGDLLGSEAPASGTLPQTSGTTGIDGVPKRFDGRAFELLAPIEPVQNLPEVDIE